jgi:hypothetical protein
LKNIYTSIKERNVSSTNLLTNYSKKDCVDALMTFGNPEDWTKPHMAVFWTVLCLVTKVYGLSSECDALATKTFSTYPCCPTSLKASERIRGLKTKATVAQEEFSAMKKLASSIKVKAEAVARLAHCAYEKRTTAIRIGSKFKLSEDRLVIPKQTLQEELDIAMQAQDLAEGVRKMEEPFTTPDDWKEAYKHLDLESLEQASVRLLRHIDGLDCTLKKLHNQVVMKERRVLSEGAKAKAAIEHHERQYAILQKEDEEFKKILALKKAASKNLKRLTREFEEDAGVDFAKLKRYKRDMGFVAKSMMYTNEIERVMALSGSSEFAMGSSEPELAMGSSEPELAMGSSEPELAMGSSEPELAMGSSEPELAMGSPEPAISYLPKVTKRSVFEIDFNQDGDMKLKNPRIVYDD